MVDLPVGDPTPTSVEYASIYVLDPLPVHRFNGLYIKNYVWLLLLVIMIVNSGLETGRKLTGNSIH